MGKKSKKKATGDFRRIISDSHYPDIARKQRAVHTLGPLSVAVKFRTEVRRKDEPNDAWSPGPFLEFFEDSILIDGNPPANKASWAGPVFTLEGISNPNPNALTTQHVSEVVACSSAAGAAGLIGPPTVYQNEQSHVRHANTWAPVGRVEGLAEFVEFTVPYAVSPWEVSIYETYMPGHVTKIQVFRARKWKTLWEGPVTASTGGARIFTPLLTPVDYAVRKFRVEVSLDVGSTCQIDSIKVVGFTAGQEKERSRAMQPALSFTVRADGQALLGELLACSTPAHVASPCYLRGVVAGIAGIALPLPEAPLYNRCEMGCSTRKLGRMCGSVTDTIAPLKGVPAESTFKVLNEEAVAIWEVDLNAAVPICQVEIIGDLDEATISIYHANTDDILSDTDYVYRVVRRTGDEVCLKMSPPVLGSTLRIQCAPNRTLNLRKVGVFAFDAAAHRPCRSSVAAGSLLTNATNGDDETCAEFRTTAGHAHGVVTFEACLETPVDVYSVLVKMDKEIRNVIFAFFTDKPPGDIDDLSGAAYTTVVEGGSAVLCADMGAYAVKCTKFVRVQFPTDAMKLFAVRVFADVMGTPLAPIDALKLEATPNEEQETAEIKSEKFPELRPRKPLEFSIAGAMDPELDTIVTPAGLLTPSMPSLARRLHESVSKCNITDVAALLRSDELSAIDIDCRDSWNRTPLHVAVKRGSTPVATVLLAQGASPLAKDRLGNTPLHVLATTGSSAPVPLAAMLVSHETFMKAMEQFSVDAVLNAEGNTVWHLCARHNAVELGAFLLRFPQMCNQKLLMMRNRAGQLAADVPASPAMGRTLENAWRAGANLSPSPVMPNGSLELFEKAVRRGDVRGMERNRPHDAYWVCSVNGTDGADEDDGFSPDNLIGVPTVFFNDDNYGDQEGTWSPAEETGMHFIDFNIDHPVQPALVEVYEVFNPGAVCLLEGHDPELDKFDKLFECTPNAAPKEARIFVGKIEPPVEKTYRRFRLHLDGDAVQGYQDIDAIRIVGANTTGPDQRFGENKETALCIAASRGDVACLSLLLAVRASPILRDAQGFSPLHRAVLGNHYEAAQILLGRTVVHEAYSKDPEYSRNANGETLMHSCARVGSAKFVHLLAAFDVFADLSVPNNQGMLAKEVATTAAVRALLSEIETARATFLVEDSGFPAVDPSPEKVCAVCFVAPPPGESVRWECGCHASYCADCLQHLVSTALNSGGKPQCANLMCDTSVPWRVLYEEVSTNQLLTIFSMRLAETKAIQDIPSQSLQRCSVCNCLSDKGIVYTRATPRYQCPVCHVQLCVVCNSVFPVTEMTDADGQNIGERIHGKCIERFAESRTMELFQKLMEFVAARRCPKCSKSGLKDDACTHMTCCKEQWCFVCGYGDADVKQDDIGAHGRSSSSTWLNDPTQCPMYIYPLAIADSRVAAVGCEAPDCSNNSCNMSDCRNLREFKASALLVEMRVRYALLKLAHYLGKVRFGNILEQFDMRESVDRDFFGGEFPWEEDTPIPEYYEFDPVDCREFYKQRESWFNIDCPKDFSDAEEVAKIYKQYGK